MPFDGRSGHSERSRGVRTWPALEVHQADPQTRDLIQAFLLDFGIAAIDDNDPGISRVFFHEAGDRDRAADGLRRQFPCIGVLAIDVPDEDWAARSQAALHAVRVGNVIVAPPWDVPETGGLKQAATYVGAGSSRPITVIIQPSMGFGTGHHATTRLCLAALQQIDLSGLRVIDVGTGSGVLAIAASRLGAKDVVAIDDDPDAVASARENLELNPEARVTLNQDDLRIQNRGSLIPAQFDLIVANLTGALLIAAAATLRSLTGSSGRLVLSGLMEHEQDDVLRAFDGFDLARRDQEDEWVCVTLSATTPARS